MFVKTKANAPVGQLKLDQTGEFLKVKYKIADGKVKLHLTRTFRIISLPRFFVQTSFYTQSNL